MPELPPTAGPKKGTGEPVSASIRKAITQLTQGDEEHPLGTKRMLAALTFLGVCVAIGALAMTGHSETLRLIGLALCALGAWGAAWIYWGDLSRIRLRVVGRDNAIPLARELWIILAAIMVGIIVPAALLLTEMSPIELSASMPREQSLKWLLPSDIHERCVASGILPEDAIRTLLQEGKLLARGQRVRVDFRGNRTTENEAVNIRPGEWQRFVLSPGLKSAVAQDGVFGQFVGLEMAIVIPCK